jgi:hypothetical protein
MRSTLTYTFMTVCLGSVLGYTVWSAERPLGFVRSNETPIVITSADEAANAKTLRDQSAKSITAGAAREHVLASLGEPDLVDSANDRWTYGSNVLIFKNDCVTGVVKADQRKSLNHAIAMFKAEADRATEAASSKSPGGRSTGGKILTLSTSRNASAQWQQYGRRNPGSSRGYGRHVDRNEDYSYYMSRSGPQNRGFFRKPSIPRGMIDYFGQNAYARGNQAYVVMPDGRRVNRNGSYLQRNHNESYDRR